MEWGGAMNPGDFVFVSWLDALSQDEWTSREEASIEPCEIHSVGILVEKTKSKIVLALSHDTVNDNMSCIKVIPQGMILKVVKLKKST